MDEELAALVRQRAGWACEYCQLPAQVHPGTFEIEHIVALQHGGSSTPGNLAFACLRCNRCKGPNLAGIDRETSSSKLVPLFHPRRHKWARHFRWDGPVLIGLTPLGRVTIQVLAINDPIRLALREELIGEGFFPPASGR